MKARIHPVAPTALVWNYTEAQPGWAALQEACQSAGLRLKPIDPSQAGANVGWLCGVPGASEASLLLQLHADAYPPALLLNGLPTPKLDAFLARLRAGNVVIPLKAMVTPTNQRWSLCELLDELLREHDALSRP